MRSRKERTGEKREKGKGREEIIRGRKRNGKDGGEDSVEEENRE